jgi:FkbM family methyltransferase
MFNSVRWKFREHSDLVRYGVGYSIVRDFISYNYRKSHYKYWCELPGQLAALKGFKFSENTPSTALREIFLEEIYNVEGFKPENGQTVIDVGANYGDSSIWWAKTFGCKVVAFEPLVNVFNVLVENIKLNNADVVAHNLALGNGDDIIGRSDGNMFSSGGDVKIRSAKLDSYSFESVDLLKIDVEGFEMDVLEGAENTIRRFKPRIIIETHSKDLRKRCHAFLSSLGYSLQVEGRTVTSKMPGMDRVTNLFYSFQAR